MELKTIYTSKRDINKITLINPLNGQEEIFSLRPTWLHRLFAPVYELTKKNIKQGLVDFVLIIVTIGLYWFFLPKILQKRKVEAAIKKGFHLKNSRDSIFLKDIGIFNDGNPTKISLGRLGSADDTFPEK